MSLTRLISSHAYIRVRASNERRAFHRRLGLPDRPHRIRCACVNGGDSVNNTTRRHPRTLQEAFGPYCSRHITDAYRREQRWHVAMYVLVALFSLLAVAGILGA